MVSAVAPVLFKGQSSKVTPTTSVPPTKPPAIVFPTIVELSIDTPASDSPLAVAKTRTPEPTMIEPQQLLVLQLQVGSPISISASPKHISAVG